MSSSLSLRAEVPSARESLPLPAVAETSFPLLAPGFARVLVAFTLFLVLGLWFWVGYQIRRESQEALEQAERNLVNLTRALAERTARIVEGADQVLRFVRRDYLEGGTRLGLGHRLERDSRLNSIYAALAVLGPDGAMVQASPAFLTLGPKGGEAFRFHAQGFDDKLFIGPAEPGQASGQGAVVLARRIDRRDGSFGGMVVLSLPSDILAGLYSDFELGRDGGLLLVGQDGKVHARAGGEPHQGGQNMVQQALLEAARRQKAGTLALHHSPRDIDRIWAFRSLDEYGLLVVAGMPTEEVLREPLPRRLTYLAAASVTTMTLLGFTLVLLRTLQRQHRLVTRLRGSERSAKAASEMKTRFLASVSHELRTPLNGILGYAELIRDTSDDAASREYGGIVHQSAQHLHRLVNTLLDLAKIESGRMTLQVRPLVLSELIEEVGRLNEVFAQSRGLCLEVHCSPQAPACIDSDHMRLVQVLNNLLNNAIKFTEEGGRIALRVEPASQGVRIIVQDNGIGIPASQLRTLFIRFHAAITDFVHPGQGAGLGLPLSRELVELLGGTLQIESAVGRGTRVVVSLPLQAPAWREGGS